MANIEIRNESGQLIAYDPSTDTQIPLPIDGIDINEFTLGTDGPATSFSDIANAAQQDSSFTSLDTENLYAKWNSEGGAHLPESGEGRPLWTNTGIDIYVDPSSGDDTIKTSNITSSNPIKTFQEALRRIPMFVMHYVKIYLADGTYSASNYPGVEGPILVNNRHSDEPIVIEGNTSTPSNVVLDAVNTSFTFYGGDTVDHIVRGIQFEGRVQSKGGATRFVDCRWEGNRALNSDHVTAITSYTGDTMINGCTFNGSNLDHIAGPTRSAMFIVEGGNNLTEPVNKWAFKPTQGSKIILPNEFHGIRGEYGLVPKEKEGIEVILADTQLENPHDSYQDDFSDGRLFENRIGGDKYIRPNWEEQSSPVTNPDTKMVVGAGGRAQRDLSYLSYFDFVFDFQFQNAPTSGSFVVSPLEENFENEARIQVWPDGTGGVDVNIGGNLSNDVITATDWNGDDARYRFRLSRTFDADGNGNEGYEFFIDGADQGHYTDSSSLVSDNVYIDNNTDADVNIYNLSIKQPDDLSAP
jgi:hypothetical protein